MNIKHSMLLFFTGLMLSGCNKQISTSCSSPDTQKLIGQLLTNQAAKLTADKKYDYYDGSFVFGAVKIRASLDQVQVATENSKTVKEDSNSSKKLCSGLLKVTIPTNMLADADQAREIQHEPKIAEYAKQFNIENSSNVFTQDVEYSVQLTGNGKEQHAEIEGVAWGNLLDQIVTSALLKTTLEAQETDHVQLNEQPKQEVERLKPESEADKLGAMQEKQALERLNKELLEAEQAQKELLQERTSPQGVPTQSLPSVTTAKQISPSFNCAKATKPTEITICVNPDLAALDVKNMNLYIKAKSIDVAATKEIWKESIKSKYDCGTDVECIKEVYKKSIINYGCVGADKESDCAVADQ